MQISSAKVAHLESVTSFLAMEIFALAEQLEANGKPVIHLEFGEPDFPTPEPVVEAAVNAMRAAKAKYTHTQGTSDFREAVVNKFNRLYNASLSPNQVLTSAGSSILLYLSMRLLTQPGDKVILTDPCYACYDNLLKIAGLEPVRVPLRLEDGFQLNPDEVKKRINPRTKAIIINSPMNPTGVAFKKEVYQGLAELGLPIISDEIYNDLVYEGRGYSMLEFTDNCIVISGMSKYYAMTGWRLGYMILPPAWVPVAARIHQNMMISASEFVQVAAITAMTEAEPQYQKMKAEFGKRRLHLLEGLKTIGLDPGYRPNSAFYVLFRYPNKIPSLDLAKDILQKTQVALTPGVDFGPGGEGFLRFSYANSIKNIEIALERLAKYFG